MSHLSIISLKCILNEIRISPAKSKKIRYYFGEGETFWSYFQPLCTPLHYKSSSQNVINISSVSVQRRLSNKMNYSCCVLHYRLTLLIDIRLFRPTFFFHRHNHSQAKNKFIEYLL